MRTLHFTVILVCPIAFEPLKMGTSCTKMPVIPKLLKKPIIRELTGCIEVVATQQSEPMLWPVPAEVWSILLDSERQEAPAILHPTSW